MEERRMTCGVACVRRRLTSTPEVPPPRPPPEVLLLMVSRPQVSRHEMSLPCAPVLLLGSWAPPEVLRLSTGCRAAP